MSLTLYDATVTGYIRTLTSVLGVMAKGKAYYADNALDLESIPAERLCGDMLPFAFQINSIVHHSIEAIEGVQSGTFGIPHPMEKTDFASLVDHVEKAIAKLKALKPEEVNGLAGKDVTFVMGETKIPFTAEGFLMSFSIPNFHFHATTTYDILRMKGVALGKRDYLGALDIKTA
jgi:hypothetical protein